ncbi:DUF7147 family protein [Shouchella shacheensis]|uniref:DUF7147 family protein n=1 Tax=Shouchella shacheensis TaxID=1649580 RepID=UPI00074013E2|nr:hypothetical protein [Shouchella shacheensis]
MIQRFIELGEGYTDFFELLELATRNEDRIHAFLKLSATLENRQKYSLAIALKPVRESKFMPIYICREGFMDSSSGAVSQRVVEFQEFCGKLNQPLYELEVRPMDRFHETRLYDQYLIGLLRLHHFLPPMS